MCGIAGIVKFNGQPIETSELKGMTDALLHRGPDGFGHWTSSYSSSSSFPSLSLPGLAANTREPRAGLGHRRLAIIDLTESGAQPMVSHSGKSVITYNGEIYNYLELKESLKRQDIVFRTQTDTEVLLELYEREGPKALDLLDGMFSFAIWNTEEKSLFCARDRFGEKPFYYYQSQERTFMFASEIKAFAAKQFQFLPNEERLFNYLAHRAIEDPLDLSTTFYKNIYQLEPGHYLYLNSKGEVSKTQYWSLSWKTARSSRSASKSESASDFGQKIEEFKALFDESLQHRLRSDVAIGTSLSGGIDSTAIACAISKLKHQGQFSQKSFSARMKEAAFDEGPFMDMAIKASKVEAFQTWINSETIDEQIEKVAHHHDEPILSTAVVSHWMVMKLAKEEGVTVLIDGQGPDEALAGYDGYSEIYLRELYLNDRAKFSEELDAFDKVHGRKFHTGLKFKAQARMSRESAIIGRLIRKVGWHASFDALHPDRVRLHKHLPVPFMRFNDLNQSLHHSTTRSGLPFLLKMCDRNSMAHSREVRLPFLNHRWMEFCFDLPSEFKISKGWSKFIMRRAFEPILPKEIAWRKDKKGFSTPQESWLSQEPLKGRVNDAVRFLQSERWITTPDTSKSWEYLSSAMFLKGLRRLNRT